MQTRVQKWGNSLALRIPRNVAMDLGLTADSRVDLCMREGRLEVTPVTEEPLCLAELLAAVTEENLHGETETGEAVGREEW
jgi:antitoxin MazE